MNVHKRLFQLQDLKYREFLAPLIPNVPKASIIGVRTPALRKFAKEIYASDMREDFLLTLPHTYHEENLLHFFILAMIPDYDLCVEKINEFLPYVTNWSVCDQSSPKVFKKHHAKLIKQVKEWIESPHLYTSRFGMRILMNEFLQDEFLPEYLEWVGRIQTEEYYLQMMQAWYFATALAKQYDATVAYLEQKTIHPTVLKMTVRKARESYRVSEEHKEYLKTLIS